jgi:hypothetical protein
MRPLQDDVVDNILLPVDEAYSPANQADAVFNVSPVSGINDSAYNPFPASPSYMQGGFAPTIVDEPRYYAPTPVYEQPYQPPYQEPISVIEPAPPYMPFPIKEIPPAYYVPNPDDYPPKYAPLPIEDERPPYQPYKPPYEQPIYEMPAPPQYYPRDPIDPIKYPIDPIDPIFLLPINPNLPQVPPRDFPHQCPDGTITYDDCAPTPVPTPAPMPAPPASEPTPVDAIKTGVMPPEYRADVTDPITVTPPVNAPVVQPSITPETPLPTKAVSKDLKPYIIAGIAVIGILIASRLLSKK